MNLTSFLSIFLRSPGKPKPQPTVAIASIATSFPSPQASAEESESQLASLLESSLRKQGYAPTRSDNRITLPSGLHLRAALLETVDLGEHDRRTVTTITASHDIAFPEGLLEFQHAAGDDQIESIEKGFETWAQFDLVVLEDALRPEPQDCRAMEMQFPGADGSAGRTRQILLGPAAHLVQRPSCDTEHPFCPCCLLTHSMDAFRSLFESDRTLGLRLFAMRDENGNPGADCRVNGEDYPQGIDRLKDYARGWADGGFEWRKQYVIVRTVGADKTAC